MRIGRWIGNIEPFPTLPSKSNPQQQKLPLRVIHFQIPSARGFIFELNALGFLTPSTVMLMLGRMPLFNRQNAAIYAAKSLEARRAAKQAALDRENLLQRLIKAEEERLIKSAEVSAQLPVIRG